jgi:hypothetical protein
MEIVFQYEMLPRAWQNVVYALAIIMVSCREKLGWISQANDATDPNAQYSVYLHLRVINLVLFHYRRSLDSFGAVVFVDWGFSVLFPHL